MNRDEAFEFLGITKFHELGYTGSRVKIMSDEKIIKDRYETDAWKKVINPKGYQTNKGKSHGSSIMYILQDICSDAEFIAFPMDMKSTGESQCVEYILKNNVHLFTTSSVGGECSKAKEKAMQDCIDNGTTFFCASGNRGERGMLGEAKSDKYLAIGSLEPNIKLKKADYSSIGKELDYVSIGFYGYGTSYTTPTFCAMCGLVQDFFIDKVGRALHRDELIKFINDHLIDVEEKGFDTKTGHGLFILPNPLDIDIKKYIRGDEMKAELQIDNKMVLINGEQYLYDVAPFIKNNRTFVPIRFLEDMGFTVDWIESERKVEINSKV